MDETVESAASETEDFETEAEVEDTGSEQTTESAEGSEPEVDSPAESEGAAPAQPQYFSVEQAQQMFQATQQHYNDQLASMQAQMIRELRRAQQPRQPKQPNTPPQFFPDDPREMAEWDVHDYHKALRGQYDHMQQQFDGRMRALEQRYQQMAQQAQVKERSDKIYSYLQTNVDTAVSKLPGFKGHDGKVNERALRFLHHEIAAEVRDKGLNNVNIPALAQGISDWIMGEAKSRYQQKVQAVSKPRPKGPARGTGAAPRQKKPTTLREASRGFAEQLRAAAAERE